MCIPLNHFQAQYENELRALHKQLQEKQNTIDEKEEESYTLNEQLINKQEQLVQEVNRIKDQVKARDEEIRQLRTQLQASGSLSQQLQVSQVYWVFS